MLKRATAAASTTAEPTRQPAIESSPCLCNSVRPQAPGSAHWRIGSPFSAGPHLARRRPGRGAAPRLAVAGRVRGHRREHRGTEGGAGRGARLSQLRPRPRACPLDAMHGSQGVAAGDASAIADGGQWRVEGGPGQGGRWMDCVNLPPDSHAGRTVGTALSHHADRPLANRGRGGRETVSDPLES